MKEIIKQLNNAQSCSSIGLYAYKELVLNFINLNILSKRSMIFNQKCD